MHRRNFIKRGPSPSLVHLQRAERTIVLSLPLTDTPGILSHYSSLGHPQPGGQLLTILGGIFNEEKGRKGQTSSSRMSGLQRSVGHPLYPAKAQS